MMRVFVCTQHKPTKNLELRRRKEGDFHPPALFVILLWFLYDHTNRGEQPLLVIIFSFNFIVAIE